MKQLAIILFIALSLSVSAQKADSVKMDTTYINTKIKGLIDNYNLIGKEIDKLTKQINDYQKQLTAIEGAVQVLSGIKEEQKKKK